jgi:hypothetical protein
MPHRVALQHAFGVLQRQRVIGLIVALGATLRASVQMMGSEALVYVARRGQ